MKIEEIKNEFVSPSSAYRGKPFWSWNGELRSEELLRQTDALKEMGMGGYFMHSRSGLITDYLGEEWFELINQVADKAEKDGMEAWLYDEDRWPSGSAGGMVTSDRAYSMKSLYVYETAPQNASVNENTIDVYAAKIDGINLWKYKKVEMSEEESADKAVLRTVAELDADCSGLSGEWRTLRFDIVPDEPDSNYNGNTYIDTMSRKAVDRFIELTHEKYAKHCGDRLGKSIKGIFTDEPHRGHCLDNMRDENGVRSCAFCYTDDIFDEFEKRYGFAVRDSLPELFYRVNGERVSRARLHYIDLANNLFLERFAMPINDWCKNHGIIFTGHVLHEDNMTSQTAPNGSLMRFYEHMGYPGVDCLTEYNNAYWIVKQLSSAARQLGKRWMLSELYGCTGWQFNFKSHKAVGDWQSLFGINIRCHHLSWYSMEGEAKRDYPASILHQSPWYRDYNTVEAYFARFGLVMSEGKADCDLLVINPIESVWCQTYIGWAEWITNLSQDVAPYESRYAELFHMLISNHVDFDYGEEQMMEKYAFLSRDEQGKAVLRVGEASYKTVLVTNMLTIRPTTLKLLSEFAEMGGRIVIAGEAPSYVNAVLSEKPSLLAKMSVNIPFEEKALIDSLRDIEKISLKIADTEAREVFVQSRKNFGGNGYAVMAVNTDRNYSKKEIVLSVAESVLPKNPSVEEWNLESGERYKFKFKSENNCIKLLFDLEAAGSRCFVFLPESEGEASIPFKAEYETVSEHTLVGSFDYTADERNVCVLDRVKWSLDGGDQHDETEVLRADNAVRDTLGIERRGGSMLQPWYAKHFDKKNYGRLFLEYEFYADELPNGELFLAGERPELNEYRINGIRLENSDVNDFWIDECFKKMPIPANALKLGRNTVTVDVTFMRTTNVEAVYLVGAFGVSLDETKKTLTALPKKLGCENLKNYNMPFYTGSITYHITPEQYGSLFGERLSSNSRIMLTPKDFVGGCAKVTVLGKETVLGWDPYEADVTEAVMSGAPIDVTVVGTRINLFGPLHELPKPAGCCTPGNFLTRGKCWTDSYSLLDSGLRGMTFKIKKKKA